ncbi:M56 family metallopeptidase [Streptomyces sp. NPDC091292]|uniref:M56 family metallopeptidase n=1 Tax=Streptomyces sp. NPDC091292 TaxID=3365991 RepID=UPI003806241C
MIYAVWVPLLVPLFAVPAARRLGPVLPPRIAAWALAACAIVLAGCSTAALGLLMAAGALRLPFVAAYGHLSLPLLREPAPLIVPAACVAAVLLAVAAGTLVHRAQGLVRELRAAHAAHREEGCGGDLAVRVDARPYAYALPGRPGRVVVTTGMLRSLGAAEREVLFAHERAHLAGRHHVFLAVGELAAALHPALRGLRAPLGYALERWADESAATSVGDRRLAARAIGRAALATHAAGPQGAPVPRMALAAAHGPVPRRVAALLTPTPTHTHRPHRVLAAALLTCVAISTTTALEAAHDLHGNVEVAQGELSD